MKSFTIAAFIALASVATAQLEDIPSCALSCFLTPLSTDGCASLSDFACHCKSADTLFAAVTPCVQKACSAEDQATVISATEKTCAAAGVPIQVPDVSSAAPTPTATVIASSYAAITNDASSSSAAPVTTKAVYTSAYITGVPSPSSNATIASSASPTSPQFTGAAAHVTQAAGILGAAAFAFLAL